MFFNKFFSSLLKLPAVFSSSMLKISMVCFAIGRFLVFWPVVGSSIAPRWSKAEAFKETTKVGKLICGNCGCFSDGSVFEGLGVSDSGGFSVGV